jgi:hypothetical protein
MRVVGDRAVSWQVGYTLLDPHVSSEMGRWLRVCKTTTGIGPSMSVRCESGAKVAGCLGCGNRWDAAVRSSVTAAQPVLLAIRLRR